MRERLFDEIVVGKRIRILLSRAQFRRGRTREDSFGNVGAPGVSGAAKFIDLAFPEVDQRRETSRQVAVERAVAHGRLALVARAEKKGSVLVGVGHEEKSAKPRLNVFFRHVPGTAGEFRSQGFAHVFEKRPDREHVVAHAEGFGKRSGVLQTVARREVRGKHHGAHALGAESVDGKRKNERAVDSARKPEHDARSAGLFRIGANGRDEREIPRIPYGRERRRHGFGRGAPPLIRTLDKEHAFFPGREFGEDAALLRETAAARKDDAVFRAGNASFERRPLRGPDVGRPG